MIYGTGPRALPPYVPLVASEHNQMSWPAGDHTPRARGAADLTWRAQPICAADWA
jgi:hypothetical protein